MSQDDGLLDRRWLLGGGLDRPERDERLQRVRRGVYSLAATTGGDAAYLTHVLASAHTLGDRSVFSHESAAVLHGLPIFGRWPDAVHLIDERRTGGRSQLDVVRHCLGLDGVRGDTAHGLAVTSPARTAFDIALSRSFTAGVVTADAAFRQFPGARVEFADLVEWFGDRRGWRKVARVQAFGDPAAETPGESESRVLIHQLGFIRPILQFEVRSAWHRDRADFGWPEVGALGEFDGEVKYRLDRYRKGGTAADVVIREKNRENRLRRSYPHFARWDAADLREPSRLHRILLESGIPKRPGHSRGTSTPAR
jgi:hypothetical protein